MIPRGVALSPTPAAETFFVVFKVIAYVSGPKANKHDVKLPIPQALLSVNPPSGLFTFTRIPQTAVGMWQQHQNHSLPIPSGVSSTSPQKSPRLGTFASRNDDRNSESVSDGLHDIQSRLKKISLNVVETRDEFINLSDRSKDNGVALEQLMSEIKSFVAISNTHHTNQVRELARLNQLDQLEKLEHLDKLGNHVRDLELQQRELNARMDLWKKFDDDGLFDQIQQLNTVPSRLKSLEKLDNLDQLKLLADLKGAVDAFKADKQLNNQLERLGTDLGSGLQQLRTRLDNLASSNDTTSRKLTEKLESTSPLLSEKMDTLLAQFGTLPAASTEKIDAVLAKLDAQKPRNDPNEQLLSEIAAKLDKYDVGSKVQGEVRAIQDHLLGEHDETRKEVNELRQKVLEQNTELEKYRSLYGPHEKLLANIEKLREQERRLIAHNAELKTELKVSTESLAANEAKYRELENHVRDVMISKYQAAIDTTNVVKDSEIMIPKRRQQNRSVSLQTS